MGARNERARLNAELFGLLLPIGCDGAISVLLLILTTVELIMAGNGGRHRLLPLPASWALNRKWRRWTLFGRSIWMRLYADANRRLNVSTCTTVRIVLGSSQAGLELRPIIFAMNSRRRS